MLKFPHVHQSYSWDCGLACLKMILRYMEKDESSIKTYMKDIDLQTSVWTIDLAYILSRYSIASTLHTLSFEVQEEYASMSYYKAKFNADKMRVDNLFQNADKYGFTCIKGHLTLEELVTRLSPPGRVLIALIDSNKMDCLECRRKAKSKCLKLTSTAFCIAHQYQGHYILVTAIDLQEDRVCYQNPSTSTELCFTDLSTFDMARIAKGTDEDLLIVNLSQVQS